MTPNEIAAAVRKRVEQSAGLKRDSMRAWTTVVLEINAKAVKTWPPLNGLQLHMVTDQARLAMLTCLAEGGDALAGLDAARKAVAL